jgi:hypothetical protein
MPAYQASFLAPPAVASEHDHPLRFPAAVGAPVECCVHGGDAKAQHPQQPHDPDFIQEAKAERVLLSYIQTGPASIAVQRNTFSSSAMDVGTLLRDLARFIAK